MDFIFFRTAEIEGLLVAEGFVIEEVVEREPYAMQSSTRAKELTFSLEGRDRKSHKSMAAK